MKVPEHVLDIFLQPGEFYFGDRDTRIRTLLGSCIAITMWHPRLHIGGMCHFMLPARAVKPSDILDGRYADEAMQLFQKEIISARTRAGEYQVKLFGGGNMFTVPPHHSQQPHSSDVANRNVIAARHLLRHHGHDVVAEHVGMRGHRNVIFELWSGDVWMRHVKGFTQAESIGHAKNQCIDSR
jgi:chemotaxis protein CheD